MEPTPAREPLYLGVDGGGTRTRIAAVGGDGALLGRGAGGPGNHHDVGREGLAESLARARDELLAAAAKSLDLAGARVHLAMASTVSEGDRALVRSVALELGLGRERQVSVDHDISGALAGGLAGEPGIVLIAGTGSACFGRSPAGRTWRAGGWGSLLDDGGSATFLGTRGLAAVVRAHDGRGPSTVLGARLLAALGIDSMGELLRRVDTAQEGRSERAALAPLVTAAAREGDEVALGLLAEGAEELALMVSTVARELERDFGAEPIPVAVCGGLRAAGEVFLDPLRAAIGRAAPRCQLREPRLPAMLGAVLLAVAAGGSAAPPGFVENLERSWARAARP